MGVDIATPCRRYISGNSDIYSREGAYARPGARVDVGDGQLKRLAFLYMHLFCLAHQGDSLALTRKRLRQHLSCKSDEYRCLS